MSRSTLLVASAATFTVALAACSDSPVAPAAASPLAPSAALVVRPASSVALTFKVGADSWSDDGVAGTTYEFSTNTGVKTTVVDNGAGDLDPADGSYKVMMPSAGSYTAKAIVLPSLYSFDGATKTGGAFSDPTHATLGAVYLHEKSALFITLTVDGAKVLGQTVKLTGPNGYTQTITDGGPGDVTANGSGQGAKDGTVIVSLPGAGGYYLCPASTPKMYYDAPCQSVSAPYYDYAYSTTMNWTQKWFIPVLPH